MKLSHKQKLDSLRSLLESLAETYDRQHEAMGGYSYSRDDRVARAYRKSVELLDKYFPPVAEKVSSKKGAR